MNKHTIEQRTADILSARDIDAIANPVNCVGTMGKGLAMQFARRFPEIVRPYQRACRNAVLRVGKPLLHDLGRRPHSPLDSGIPDQGSLEKHEPTRVDRNRPPEHVSTNSGTSVPPTSAYQHSEPASGAYLGRTS